MLGRARGTSCCRAPVYRLSACRRACVHSGARRAHFIGAHAVHAHLATVAAAPLAGDYRPVRRDGRHESADESSYSHGHTGMLRAHLSAAFLLRAHLTPSLVLYGFHRLLFASSSRHGR